jgi:hypothetical protein
MNVSPRTGTSLIEVLIGIVIFAVAMVPLLSLSQSATRDTYSMAKHLIASQLAASIMDRALTFPFSRLNDMKKAPAANDEVDVESEMTAVAPVGTEVKFLSHQALLEMLKNMPTATEPQKGMNIQQGVSKAFQGFKYRVEFSDQTDEVVTVKVTVSWPQREGDPASKRLVLSRFALKYRED